MHSLSLLLALVSALLSLGAAALYFPARQFKPYHAVVSGREWSALEPGVQTIIRGMLRIVASGFLACGLALLFLLLPLNRGEVWAPLGSRLRHVASCAVRHLHAQTGRTVCASSNRTYQRHPRVRCGGFRIFYARSLAVEWWHLTTPSSGRPPASCAGFRSPLMSNVRCHQHAFPIAYQPRASRCYRPAPHAVVRRQERRNCGRVLGAGFW